MSSRRVFVRLAGTSALLAAAGGLAACAEIPEAANAPWREAGRAGEDMRLTLLSYAILAPNPHNIQPWAVDLSEPDTVVVYRDRDRLLPETDPFHRQITIGLGCFLEAFDLAARQFGRHAEIALFPAGMPDERALDDRPIARIRLREAAVAPDPLFAHLLARRSNKKAYDTAKPAPPGALAALARAAGGAVPLDGTTDAALVADLRRLTYEAGEIELRTPRTHMESVRLMRIGGAEIARHRDGISLGGTGIEFARTLGMVTREALADPKSSAFARGLDRYRTMCGTAMGFTWIVTPGNDRRQQIAVGRAHMRANLAATALGMAYHPLMQATQEFPEMAAKRGALAARLGAGARTVQMLCRFGYAEAAVASPRRPLEAAIRTRGT